MVKNENFFDVIDTEEKAYFLGLLYADGCNYEDKGIIKIDLIEKDSYILETLKDLLKANNKISHYPAKTKLINGKYCDCQPSCRLLINNKHISSILASYGMISHKSKKGMYIKNNIIPDYLYNHWIRGLIDGNGGISYWVDNIQTEHKKFQINYCGTTDIVNKLATYFSENFNCKPTITSRYPDRNNNNLQFTICGNQIVRKITDWLYKNATIYLQRKYDKYLELIKENNRKENDNNVYGSAHPKKAIVNINTCKKYESLAAAGKDTGKNSSWIYMQIKTHKNGWLYYEDILNDIELSQKYKNIIDSEFITKKQLIQ